MSKVLLPEEKLEQKIDRFLSRKNQEVSLRKAKKLGGRSIYKVKHHALRYA